jgi:N4-gp56 family major capsid protein
MPQFDATAAAVFIPEVWSAKMVVAREANMPMADRVWRWDEDVAGFGDTIHVPHISKFSAVATAPDGTVTFQSQTETETSITLSNQYDVSFRITDRVLKQAKYNLIKEYTAKAGKGLARQVDSDILGQWSSLSTYASTISAVDAITEDEVLASVECLDLSNAPEEDRYGALYPTQKRALLKIDKFVSELYRPGAGQQITKGRFTMDIHGIEFVVTTLVPTSTTVKNMIWQKDAFALAIQKKVTFEELAKDGKRRNFSADEIYGFGIPRDDHAVLVPTNR